LISEKDIINRCKKQDPKAQEMLFKKYSGYMMGICMRYSGNREDARDLLHDGFIKAFKGIKDFNENSSVKTWLSAIFVNTAISHLRLKAKTRVIEISDSQDIDFEDEADDVLLDEMADQLTLSEVLEMIQSLPDKYRIILNLYAIDNFSHKDIALELNISEGTSKSQLSRARKLLGALIYQKKTQYEKAS
jgi:RNA polymerase sigma factor (sigma-70 family)